MISAVISSTATSAAEISADKRETAYILNKNTKKIHCSDCPYIELMNEDNKIYTDNYDRAILIGYIPCEKCSP